MTTDSEIAPLLAIARVAADAASAVLKDGVPMAGSDVGKIRAKSNRRDLVTEWDTRSEEIIRSLLEERAPGIAILGEEGGATAGAMSGGDCWLVDPIDGTFNFAHGLPIYAISIALERAGQTVLGVVHAPALGYEFFASVGGGAFLNERPIRVSEISSIGDAMLSTGFPYDRAETSHNFAEWEHLQRTAGACRRLGAASLDLAFVACGCLDGYWETKLSPWDLGAGAVLVAEAGGMVTDITGGPFRVRSGNAIASNGAIHKEILDHLETVDRVIRTPGKDIEATS